VEILKSPAPFSFVKNPIVFEFTTDSDVMRVFTIAFAGESFLISVYPSKTDAVTWKLSFDISDLLANLVRLTYDATLISQVNLAGFVQSYTVTEPVSAYSFTGKIIPGGLSLEFQKFMIHQDTNAFDYRFMNPMSNWLLTTRTDANVIKMTRRELACMFFLTPNNQQISVATNNGDVLNISTGTAGIPCMVNLPVWLASLSPESQLSTSVFFQVAGLNVIQINITDRFSEESYLVKFRNSLGVYEFIEVSGKAQRAPESGESSAYNMFDTDLQEFSKARQRVNTSNVLNVDSGFKSMDDLYFLGDMLAASSMWFIDRLKKFKCLVTSSNYTHALRQTTPESVSLKIEPVTTEQYYTPMTDINTIYTLLATEDDEFIITEDNFMIGV